MDKIREKIELLTKELNRHNHNYYDLRQPEISDFEFDKFLGDPDQVGVFLGQKPVDEYIPGLLRCKRFLVVRGRRFGQLGIYQ